MIALVRMRLVGFVQTGRAAAPLFCALVVLSILYGGGQSQAGEAYGVSAAILFAVLAWQTKVLMDVEPDVQRRLSRIAVGGATREIAAGLLAAVLAGLPVVLVALILPWVVGGVTTPRAGDPPLSTGIALGVWAHLLLLLPAVVLGALASRAVTGHTGRGLTVLVAGIVFAIVFGLKSFPVPWLAPPVMVTARDTVGAAHLPAVLLATGWGIAWSAVFTAVYARIRREQA
ncbi:hypothetical protein GCM10018962_18370 [Dactylosporangium matsuzakiense]|uniref:Uncharacterized protein n=2 Tax=Dactylosporangium matsuzakiense TaxID=53360 RepID=A0A9W6NJP3_9ACTN|nr:hypothetical protein Dmats_44490 [Dactylosporangium matsuzakiense]GLK99488.1 hypothetical protein GCM10017581_012290 [Dactylosporangium matsuzakiense]